MSEPIPAPFTHPIEDEPLRHWPAQQIDHRLAPLVRAELHKALSALQMEVVAVDYGNDSRLLYFLALRLNGVTVKAVRLARDNASDDGVEMFFTRTVPSVDKV